LTHFQLSFPPEMNAERLLAEMTSDLLRTVGQAGISWPTGQVTAKETMRRIFDKHVSAFDACDCYKATTEVPVKAAWNTHIGPLNLENARCYHLRMFHEGLEQLASGSAHYILKSCGQASSLAAEQLQWDLAQCIRLGFGPYMFQSLPGGRIEQCHMAQPVDSWQLSHHL
jgi:hypothetical protein